MPLGQRRTRQTGGRAWVWGCLGLGVSGTEVQTVLFHMGAFFSFTPGSCIFGKTL